MPFVFQYSELSKRGNSKIVTLQRSRKLLGRTRLKSPLKFKCFVEISARLLFSFVAYRKRGGVHTRIQSISNYEQLLKYLCVSGWEKRDIFAITYHRFHRLHHTDGKYFKYANNNKFNNVVIIMYISVNRVTLSLTLQI